MMNIQKFNGDEQSEDVMDELFAVGISLSSHDVNEDQDNDVVGDVGGVLDDGVRDQKEGSNILEAVAGQQESDSGSFDGISQNGFNFLAQVAGVIDNLGLVDEGKEFGLGLEVFRILH